MSVFLVLITVALLLIALEPAHRRASRVPGWDPADRDSDRVHAELTARDRGRGVPNRIARMLAAAATAVPMHRARVCARTSTDPDQMR